MIDNEFDLAANQNRSKTPGSACDVHLKALYKFFFFKGSETSWADQSVLHLKLTFNNKRSSPLRIVSKIDNRQQSTIVQPNSKYLLEDILVRLAINDDVIDKEISFQFFDEETGNQLLIGGKRNLDMSYQLVGENVYRVTKAFDIDENSKALSTLYTNLKTFSIKSDD